MSAPGKLAHLWLSSADRFGKGVIRERQPLGERVNLHACHQRGVSARISVQIEKAQVLIGRLEGGAVIPKGIVATVSSQVVLMNCGQPAASLTWPVGLPLLSRMG